MQMRRLSIAAVTVLIMAVCPTEATIVRGPDASGGSFYGQVGIISLAGDRVVTAVGGVIMQPPSSFKMEKLIVWDIDGSSNLHRRGDAVLESQGGEPALTAMPNGRFATSSRLHTGELVVTVWDIDASGNLTQRGMASTAPGETSKMSEDLTGRTHQAITWIGGDGLLTADQDEKSGKLRVINWSVDRNGNVSRRGQVLGEAAISVRAVALGLNRAVIAYAEENSGHVKMTLWKVNRNGLPTKGSEALDDLKTYGHFTIAANGPSKWLSYVTPTYGALVLSSWLVGDDGKISKLAASPTDLHAGEQIAAHGEIFVQADPNPVYTFRITWFDTNYPAPQKSAEASAGEVHGVSVIGGLSDIKPDRLSTAKRVVTAVRTNENNLKVIVWHLVSSIVH